MREIIIKSIHLENFKIFQNVTYSFSQLTRFFAQNYQGKSSIVDGFFWVLFGKSSTGNSEGKNFTPRRGIKIDDVLVPVDHVDVIVEIVLDIDGREVAIRKVQKQNWVRKRGSESTTYEGDANEYYWNEIPVKESEHKKKVSEIIDENIFKILTNPHAFVSQKQDDQRKFLVENVAKITDEDVFAIDSEYHELKLLTETKTIDEIKAINKVSLKKYKEQQETIPVRIDEVSKSIIEVDFSDQELALSALKEQLSEAEAKLSDTSKSYEDVAKLKSEIAEYKSKISEIENTEKALLSKKKQETTSKLDSAGYNLLRKTQQLTTVKSEKETLSEKISAWEITFTALGKRYSEEKAKEMSDSECICPTCNKEFDESKKAELTAKFIEDKKAKLHQINLDGQKIQSDIKTNKERLAELEKQVSDLTTEIEKLTGEKSTLEGELNAIPTEIDLSSNTEYQGFKSSLSALEFALKETEESLADTNALKASLTAKKAEIQSQIQVVQGVLASKKHIDDAKDRVIELREELRQATNKAAECERLEFLLEKFEKAKMNLLSSKINQKFKLVKWQLFRTQKNGGIENVCIPMVHGSPYGENTTSTTERLMAGLDIINTLQEIYEIKAPIWIDNAEAYNDFNIPEMDCQMVLLRVSEDEVIRVEG